MCLFVLQNQQQSNILDRLYQIMFRIIVLSQIGADKYKKTRFRNTTFPPLFTKLESCVYWGVMFGTKLPGTAKGINLMALHWSSTCHPVCYLR